jgi:DNA/RNA non-specific endonuclease/Proteins of 100 residues with WXG
MSLSYSIMKDFPGFPKGQPGEIRAAASAFHNLSLGIGNVADTGQRHVVSSTVDWKDDVKTAFVAEWDEFRAGLDEAVGQIQQIAVNLDHLADTIELAQHKYEGAIVAAGATFAVGVGFTVLTAGVSDGVADAAVTAEVGVVATEAAEAIDGVAAVLSTAADVVGGIAARLVVPFAANVAGQAIAGAIVYPDHDPFDHLDLKAAGFAAISDVAVGGAAGLFGRFAEEGTAAGVAIRMTGAGVTGAGLAAISDKLLYGKVDGEDVALSGLGAAAGEGFEGLHGRIAGGPAKNIVDLTDKDRPEFGALSPNTIYRYGGSEFETDGAGRVVRAADVDLTLGKGARDPQATAIGKLGSPGDEGGHLIGTQFRSFPVAPNVVPQAMNLNRGAGSEWTALERDWAVTLKAAAASRQPVNIRVEIRMSYGDGTLRPEVFQVKYWENGVLQPTKILLNK